MKKLLAVLGVVLLTTVACKKDSDDSANTKYCWTCSTTTATSGAVVTSNTVDATVCDQTESEINEYEDAQSSTTTTGSGASAITLTVSTSCSKQ